MHILSSFFFKKKKIKNKIPVFKEGTGRTAN
jgi:hypothetical protein